MQIPIGATAQIFVPTVKGHTVQAVVGATFPGTQDEYAIYTVRSGHYTFRAAT